MTTQQVADKFYEYMQTGAFDKIYEELYSEDCVSKEAPGSTDWQLARAWLMSLPHTVGPVSI